jgi:hypothetical protein
MLRIGVLLPRTAALAACALPREEREREKKIGSRCAGFLPSICDLVTTLRWLPAGRSED